MHDLRQINAYLSWLARNHVLPKYEIMESLNNIDTAGSLSVRAGRNQFFIYIMSILCNTLIIHHEDRWLECIEAYVYSEDFVWPTCTTNT